VPNRRALVDVGVPVVLLVLTAGETAANASLDGERAATGSLVAVLVACAASRRRWPRAAAAAAGLTLGLSAVVDAHAHDESFVSVVCELLLAFAVAARCRLRDALQGFAGLLGGLLVAIALRGDLSDAVLGGIVLTASWGTGRVVHRLHAQAAELAALSAQLAEQRDRAAVDAATAERARIARDLHDVVAHHVSAMVVQAGGARGALHHDLAAAEQALLTTEATGRAALVEMRRLLGVLRGDGGRGPQPRLADAQGLLRPDEAWRSTGKTAALDDGLDLTGYRLVQEALTNARRHGTGPASVRLSWEADQLTIEVLNPAHPPDAAGGQEGGHGLVGMAERAALYGGELSAGPTGSGCWRVRAVLPLARDAAPV
jgi:signal transduction histidine kinase